MIAITQTDLEIAAIRWTDDLRRRVDDLAGRIRTVCPEHSRIRTADELRRMAKSLNALCDDMVIHAEKLEVQHGR